MTNKRLKIKIKFSLKIFVPGEEPPLTIKGRVRWVSIAPGKSYKYTIGILFNPYGEKKGQNDLGILNRLIALENKFLKRKEEEPSEILQV